MTALLETKQRIKNFYGQYEAYLLPVLKFLLAAVYFFQINAMIGFSDKLKSPFIVLIAALVCAILPENVIVWTGFALIIGNCYSLGAEVAGFALVLILLMELLFLRFSTKVNLTLALTPAAIAWKLPALLPIGSGLLCPALAAIPSGCGVILYYFMRFLKEQSAVLQSKDIEILERIRLIGDGLLKNQEMWLMLLAMAAVTLLVNLVRTRSLDYAWRIAIIVGGVTYVLVMLAGGLFLNASVDLAGTVLFTVLSVILGLVLEFFAFGGDYTRTERLQYEDDEYFYFVKAVPKVSIATSKRMIQKINGSAPEAAAGSGEEKTVVEYANPIFEDESPKTPENAPEPGELSAEETAPPVMKPALDDIDFEKKLEESLKNL